MGKQCGIKTTAIMVQIHSLALTAVCGGSNPPGAGYIWEIRLIGKPRYVKTSVL